MTDASNGHILVVDDEEEIRVLLYTLLSDAGYEVRLAPDADVAMDILSEHVIEACITDFRMPGMDGLEFVEATWVFPTRPQVIMLTGYATVDMAVEAARLGIVQICEKPFFSGHLLGLVEQAVGAFRKDESERESLSQLSEESKQVVSDAKKLLDGLRLRLADPSGKGSKPPFEGEKTIAYGPAGIVRLAHAMVIVDVVRFDDEQAAVGLFVDDEGRAQRVVVYSALKPEGFSVELRKIPQGIGYTKLRPVCTSSPTYLHVLDQEGNILPELSCTLDLSSRIMKPLPDAYSVLGLERGVEREQVERCFAELSQRFSPQTAPRATRATVAHTYSAIVEAYSRLDAALKATSPT